MGQLLRRTAAGDELLTEWSSDDDASIKRAADIYHDHLRQDYEAVQSDGTFFSPIEGDAFPADAEQIIVSTGMGGG